MLRILEDKGHLRHEKDGPRHVYFPVTPRTIAQRSAVRHMVGTFFNGSRAAAIAALLDDGDRPLSKDERAALSSVIERLRAEGQ
jgi:predicted transcriptional regulator